MKEIIIAVLGSGGLCSVISVLLSRHKFRAEAEMIEADAEAKHKQTEREYMDYIHNQLKEITETHRKEAEETRAQNKALVKRVNDLEATVNDLMEWIILDNNARVTWLETELRKYNPDVAIPPCRPAPVLKKYNPDDDELLAAISDS
jgi:DNA anti-recombination protein RmuC